MRQVENYLFLKNKARLIPSFYDRKPFRDLLNCDDSEELTDENSFQSLAMLHFTSRIKEEERVNRVRMKYNFLLIQVIFVQISSTQSYVQFYQELLRQQLDLMGLTYVEILNDINLPQVFLWLQEKSLMGEAALVFNPAPGTDCRHRISHILLHSKLVI